LGSGPEKRDLLNHRMGDSLMEECGRYWEEDWWNAHFAGPRFPHQQPASDDNSREVLVQHPASHGRGFQKILSWQTR
jgi:hypothetical protein